MSRMNTGRCDDVPVPPRDDEMRHTIEKIAIFISKHGPDAEERTRREHEGNPKFCFLFGGPFSDYYGYRVQMNIDAARNHDNFLHQQNQQQQQHPPPHQFEEQQIAAQIDAFREQIASSEHNLQAQAQVMATQREMQRTQRVSLAEEKKIVGYLANVNLDITQFTEFVEQLNNPKCSKDAISLCKKWIFDNCLTDQQREVILMYLLFRVKFTPMDDNFRVNFLYMMNDWAHQCQRKKMEPVTQMLSRYVPQMYAFTVEMSEDPNMQQRLDKLTGVWEGHKYFNDACFKQLRNPGQIYATAKSVQQAEYSKVFADIEVELNAMLAGYEQQHNNYATHIHNKIIALEGKLRALRSGDSYGRSHGEHEQYNEDQRDSGPPARRSRFDQQSRFDDEPPRRGGPGGFGQFFAPQPRVAPKEGWQEEEGVSDDYNRHTEPPPLAGDDIDGHPFNEDDLLLKAPYYEVPAGIMVPQVPYEQLTYNAIDTEVLRMPPQVPPSQRLLDALEMFYAPPTIEKPRDVYGWEKDSLEEFFNRKLGLRKIFEEKLMAEGKTIENLVENRMTKEDLEMAKADKECVIAKEIEERKKGERKSHSRSRSPKSRSRSSSATRNRTSRRRSRSSSSSSSSTESKSGSSGSSRSRSRSRKRSRSRSRSNSPSSSRRRTERRSITPPSFGRPSFHHAPAPLGSDNKGAQLMQKMGWSGRGLGAQESGIVEPINPGEVRDRVGQFRGLGSSLDPYESYRKNRSGNYHDRNQQVFADREREPKGSD